MQKVRSAVFPVALACTSRGEIVTPSGVVSLRIGKGEIDNGREPVTLDLFGEETSYQFGEDQYAARQPERLAADAAVEPIEQIKPVHIRHARANPAAIR